MIYMFTLFVSLFIGLMLLCLCGMKDENNEDNTIRKKLLENYDIVGTTKKSTGYEPYSRFDTCDEMDEYVVLKHKTTGKKIEVLRTEF